MLTPGAAFMSGQRKHFQNFGRMFLTAGSWDVGSLSFADFLGGRRNGSTRGRRSSPRWNHVERFLRTVPS